VPTLASYRGLDLLSPELTADPYPALAALRREDPVHWSEQHGAWLISRYDDVVAAFMDGRMSSDRVAPLLESMDAERRATAGQVLELIKDWMVVTDPPAHTRLRRLAARAFSPRRVAAAEERIQRLVDELLDDFVAGGHSDLVAHFTYPLPATVIAELIGAPPEDRDRFKSWSHDLSLVAFGAGGEARPDRHERAMGGLQELLDYFEQQIERARSNPSEGNMISGLLEGDDDGNVLTDEEMKAMCALMLFAGHETTTTLISTGVVTLLQHPDQLAALKADPALVATAVEEILRYEGAIKVLIRWVTDDVELHGKRIEAGQRVYLLPGSANRDEARFADPDTVDIARKPNPHVAFGKGVHACIGAQLARIESRAAIGAIFSRMPELRLADRPLEWTPSLASRALREVHVEHD
jgi:cytochrome P450